MPRRPPLGRQAPMRVLGITTEGDSGAAVVENGRILAALNEERLCRWKLVEGFPRGSIGTVLRLSGTDARDLDAVLVAGINENFVDELQPFAGWFQHWQHVSWGGRFKRMAGKVSRHRNTFPFLEPAYYALQRPSHWNRRHAIRRILRDEFGVRCPIRFVDHHFAHITSAWFTSGFDEALVVSIDGGGDGRSALVYSARDGRLEELGHASAFNSLGNYYAYVTHVLGLKAMKHEGKVTGLAAYGEPRYQQLFREMIDVEDGRLINRGGVVFMEAIREIERRLPAGWTREDVAASIQRHTEDVVRRFVGYWVKRSGMRNVALAGGVAANVRVNQEVLGLPGVERVFIHPHMGDGGLSVGAALAACVPGVVEGVMPRPDGPLDHVYLGTDLTPESVDEALAAHGLSPEPLDGPIEDRVAELLAEGWVVARASGRMEYGPRALGNRSVLYQPTDRDVNDWLNRKLRRTEYMPFAPAMLYEERDAWFEDAAGGEHPAEFMTITFNCSPRMRGTMHGVVHVDGTARPQLVRADRNPGFYRIIERFRERTGLPAVVNTSFNMHEEPIVCSAEDCVRGFLAGHLDFIALGDQLIRHPQPLDRELRPVGAGSIHASLGPFTAESPAGNSNHKHPRPVSDPAAPETSPRRQSPARPRPGSR